MFMLCRNNMNYPSVNGMNCHTNGLTLSYGF